MERPNLEQMLARAEAATEGPWSVWNGPLYVGGGADLCIGAGKTWLINMDHRAHGRAPDCDIASMTTDLDPDGITAEQRANADLIAAARTDLPAAVRYAMELEVQLAASHRSCLTALDDCDCPTCTAVRAREQAQ